MADRKGENEIAEKIKDGLQELLIDQVLPGKLNNDHVAIRRIEEILEIPFGHAAALYYGDGPEILDPYFMPPEKGMAEQIVEDLTDIRRENPILNLGYKDFLRERAAVYAKHSTGIFPPVPVAKPKTKEPKNRVENGVTSVPKPRSKPEKVVPTRKPDGLQNRGRSDKSGSLNPFDLNKTDLSRQAQLIKENPVRARQLILDAGRDPKLFGFE